MRTYALMVVLTLWTIPTVGQETSFQKARQQMVKEAVIGAGVKDPRVLKAMLSTERHLFVPTHLRSQAYFDMALPIGDQQTISSPFIVSFMTETLDPQPSDKVLEIGTGSGYQAAVLSPLVKDVYTIEIVESLGNKAARTLKRLGYSNVHVKVGDGYQGWPEHAPFDKIIVTCSPEKVPQPLVEQMAEGGLMVIPVGQRYQQTLTLLRKENEELKQEDLRTTLFVPMTGTAEETRRVLPDPSRPSIANGGFEDALVDDEFVSGWYYQRQLKCVEEDAPEGKRYVLLSNDVPGRPAHVLQGFPVDGSKVPRLDVSCQVRYANVLLGTNRQEMAVLAITFYDGSRRDLGSSILGPFLGTAAWHVESKTFRVPARAREAILRIGLFGSTGEIAFDDVRVKAAR